jgi:hypothetical protein
VIEAVWSCWASARPAVSSSASPPKSFTYGKIPASPRWNIYLAGANCGGCGLPAVRRRPPPWWPARRPQRLHRGRSGSGRQIAASWASIPARPNRCDLNEACLGGIRAADKYYYDGARPAPPWPICTAAGGSARSAAWAWATASVLQVRRRSTWARKAFRWWMKPNASAAGPAKRSAPKTSSPCAP